MRLWVDITRHEMMWGKLWARWCYALGIHKEEKDIRTVFRVAMDAALVQRMEFIRTTLGYYGIRKPDDFPAAIRAVMLKGESVRGHDRLNSEMGVGCLL